MAELKAQLPGAVDSEIQEYIVSKSVFSLSHVIPDGAKRNQHAGFKIVFSPVNVFKNETDFLCFLFSSDIIEETAEPDSGSFILVEQPSKNFS